MRAEQILHVGAGEPSLWLRVSNNIKIKAHQKTKWQK